MVNILTETCPLGGALTASFVLLQRTLTEVKWNSYKETNKAGIMETEGWF